MTIFAQRFNIRSSKFGSRAPFALSPVTRLAIEQTRTQLTPATKRQIRHG